MTQDKIVSKVRDYYLKVDGMELKEDYEDGSVAVAAAADILESARKKGMRVDVKLCKSGVLVDTITRDYPGLAACVRYREILKRE